MKNFINLFIQREMATVDFMHQNNLYVSSWLLWINIDISGLWSDKFVNGGSSVKSAKWMRKSLHKFVSEIQSDFEDPSTCPILNWSGLKEVNKKYFGMIGATTGPTRGKSNAKPHNRIPEMLNRIWDPEYFLKWDGDEIVIDSKWVDIDYIIPLMALWLQHSAHHRCIWQE